MFQNSSVLGKVLVAAAAAFILCGAGPLEKRKVNSRDVPSAVQLSATCAGLVGRTIDGVKVTNTQRFEGSTATGGSGLCKVSATRAPFLDIEVDVPDNWSGRLFHQGGGGLDGIIFSALKTDASGALTWVDPVISSRGAVYAASNGGNRIKVPAQKAPGVWANGTPEGKASADDHAYVAIGTTVKFAKAITRLFFSKGPSKTYFNGCSGGGREAFTAAQKFPDEYDGIVAGCYNLSVAGTAAAWLHLYSESEKGAALTDAQYSAAYRGATKACDADDGLVDGYLANTAACKFDPIELICGKPNADRDPALCLNQRQATLLKEYFSEMKLSDGTVIYAGFPWTDFGRFGATSGVAEILSGWAFLGTNNRAWLTRETHAAFNRDRDYPLIRKGLLGIGMDHDLDAIASYVASGKKLIAWIASGDNLLSTKDLARNFATMTELAKKKGARDPSDSTRLFVVPGNVHGAGITFGTVEFTPAIIDWVENGIPPRNLTFSFTQLGGSSAPTVGNTVVTSATAPAADLGPSRSMPVCEYPLGPIYSGAGDVNSASSFTCG